MARKLSEELQEGDPVAVALRGGAGWVTGRVVWIREEQMLIKHNDIGLQTETPFVLVDLSEITGIALPREVPADPKHTATPGFLRG
jgi:hypothetical protein